MSDKPVRIQRKRTKGWRMPQNTIYVGRPTFWGNPFTKAAAIESEYATENNWREFVVECFRDWLGPSLSDREWWSGQESNNRRQLILENLDSIRGKNLACFCKIGEPCHADVLLELASTEQHE
jgi:hypothetical protein